MWCKMGVLTAIVFLRFWRVLRCGGEDIGLPVSYVQPGPTPWRRSSGVWCGASVSLLQAAAWAWEPASSRIPWAPGWPHPGCSRSGWARPSHSRTRLSRCSGHRARGEVRACSSRWPAPSLLCHDWGGYLCRPRIPEGSQGCWEIGKATRIHSACLLSPSFCVRDLRCWNLWIKEGEDTLSLSLWALILLAWHSRGRRNFSDVRGEVSQLKMQKGSEGNQSLHVPAIT